MGKPRSFERVTASDIDAAARESKSLTELARRLGITRQTAHRWLKEGKLSGFRRQPQLREQVISANNLRRDERVTGKDGKSYPASPGAADASSFAEWCASAFDLSHAETEIVDLAQSALGMARDSTLAPAVRLAAAREFRACLRDLNLPLEELEKHGYGQAEIHAFPRPV